MKAITQDNIKFGAITKTKTINGKVYRSPTYETWRGMVERCTTLSNGNYARFGGKGIKVCKRWTGKDGFKNFIVDMGNRPTNKSIDRINPKLNYTPRNCRWATAKAKANSRRKRNVKKKK